VSLQAQNHAGMEPSGSGTCTCVDRQSEAGFSLARIGPLLVQKVKCYERGAQCGKALSVDVLGIRGDNRATDSCP